MDIQNLSDEELGDLVVRSLKSPVRSQRVEAGALLLEGAARAAIYGDKDSAVLALKPLLSCPEFHGSASIMISAISMAWGALPRFGTEAAISLMFQKRIEHYVPGSSIVDTERILNSGGRVDIVLSANGIESPVEVKICARPRAVFQLREYMAEMGSDIGYLVASRFGKNTLDICKDGPLVVPILVEAP